jgi:predicted dehydrogenase
MRIVQVGLGGFGGVWLEQVVHPHEDLDVVGLVDVNRELGEAARERLDLSESLLATDLGDLLALLESQGKRPDLVLNVTPSQYHGAINEAAFRHGIPVMSEKPLADTLEEGRAIVARAEQLGVRFAVSQNYRWKRIMTEAKKRLDEGGIGRVENVYVEFFRNPDVEGYRLEMPDVLLVDMAIHHFDLMRYLTGAEPLAVRGESWNPSWSRFKGDANLQANFRFERGIRACYTGSWASPMRETSWDGNWKIEGTRGYMRMEDDRLLIHAAGAEEETLVLTDDGRSMRRSLDLFLNSLREGRPAPTEGRDNLNSLAMVDRCRLSIREDRTVTFG